MGMNCSKCQQTLSPFCDFLHVESFQCAYFIKWRKQVLAFYEKLWTSLSMIQRSRSYLLGILRLLFILLASIIFFFLCSGFFISCLIGCGFWSDCELIVGQLQFNGFAVMAFSAALHIRNQRFLRTFQIFIICRPVEMPPKEGNR